MREERELDHIAKGPWREVARDRAAWQGLRSKWVAERDLPWASHAQLAIDA